MELTSSYFPSKKDSYGRMDAFVGVSILDGNVSFASRVQVRDFLALEVALMAALETVRQAIADQPIN